MSQSPPQDDSESPARILVLSAYDADSHRLWRTRLERMLPAFAWRQLSLPPRHFNWRIRGNSLQWGFGNYGPLLEQHDVILATSMVDLAALRGFRPNLATIPTVVYFHENQFEYPGGRHRADNIEPKLVPLYAALCADRVVFNSHYNRNSFLRGAKSLLNSLPDRTDASIMQKLETSAVIPVPLDSAELDVKPPDDNEIDNTVLEVVWNHRWEYDKGPELLLRVIELLQQSPRPIRFHLAGKQFRDHPAAFDHIDAALGASSAQQKLSRGQFGFVPGRERYLELLARCDLVLSTAQHEFQGLALQEACALGCTPLAPDRLVYPEYLGKEFLYRASEVQEETAQNIFKALSFRQAQKAAGEALPRAPMRDYLDTRLKADYEALLVGLTGLQAVM